METITAQSYGTKSNASTKLALAGLLTFTLAASVLAGTFKRITIDGSFADWAGVPLAYTDASETTAGADFRDVYVANDEQYIYIRFTLYTNDSPFTSRNNIFIDADNNPATGFHPLGLAAVGSEMLIQSGTGYQEKNGGFNEGAINGLGWAAGRRRMPRISRSASLALRLTRRTECRFSARTPSPFCSKPRTPASPLSISRPIAAASFTRSLIHRRC